MRALAIFLLLASPCSAQVVVQPFIGNCYAYTAVVAALSVYGEVSTGPALVDHSGTAVEVFISKAGSLTTVEVFPSGLTCYRGFGYSWGKQPKNMTPG